MPLKSSRSLNRSIGVRRRESEADGGTRLRQEEEEAGPDPLREQFEATKDTNPLLVRTRQGCNALQAPHSRAGHMLQH